MEYYLASPLVALNTLIFFVPLTQLYHLINVSSYGSVNHYEEPLINHLSIAPSMQNHVSIIESPQ